MDEDILKSEMSLLGCIELYHPEKKGFYHVIEQKMDDRGRFIPLEKGAYAFQITPNLTRAEKLCFQGIREILRFINDCIETHGYIWNQNDELLDIPKTEFVKWQLCNRIRHIIPQ